ncbi:MAG: SH3-like domain-containing protein, partial [Pseudomonadota bacterium]
SARSGARPAANPDRIDYAPDSASASRALTRHCAFALGDRVRTRADAVPGHTRLPSYARDQFGTVVALHDGWVFPDDNAHGRGENPQHLLTVRFRGESLWGPDAEPGVEVNLDLFESYLIKEPA